MKQKYIAGFQLAALHTLRPTLIICLAMVLVFPCATVFFASREISFLNMFQTNLNYLFLLPIVFSAILSVLCRSSKSAYCYTLRRLRLSATQMGFLWSACVGCCVLLVWGVSVVTFWGCSALNHAFLSPDIWSHQTFFIDCYRNIFLHSLLPLGDIAVWVRNLLLLAALSLGSGCAWVTAWRGSQSKLTLITIIMAATAFYTSGTYVDYFLLFAYAIICLHAVSGIFNAEEELE